RALDGKTGEPLPARLTFVGADGIIRHAEAYAQNKTLSEKHIPFRPLTVHLPFCYVPGEFEVLLPPGPARVEIERGYESPIVARDIVLEAGSPSTLDIETSRAVDMKALGWISG